MAATTRAEGESQARIIKSAADLERAKQVAQAQADAARLVGQGEADATRIAGAAQAADPAFYQFLKTLETYRTALDQKTTLVLSVESPFFKLLTQGVPDLPARPKEMSPKSTEAASHHGGRRTMSLRAGRPRDPGTSRLPGDRRGDHPAGRGRRRPPLRRRASRDLGARPALGASLGPGNGRWRQDWPDPDDHRRRPGRGLGAPCPSTRSRARRVLDRRPQPRHRAGRASVPRGRPGSLPLRVDLGRAEPLRRRRGRA